MHRAELLRWTFAALLSVTALAASTVSTHADAVSDARKAIAAAYAKMDAAISRKDVEGAYAYHTPDYQFTDKSGRRFTLAERKPRAAQVVKTVQWIKARSTVRGLKLNGNRAVADVNEAVTMVAVNPLDPKETAKIEATGAVEAVWVKTGAGWRVKSTRMLKSTLKANGRVIEQ